MAEKTDKKRIVLIINPNKPDAAEEGRRLLEWLKGRVRIVADNLRGNVDVAGLAPADFIIVLGGDGTILSTVRALGSKQVPLIGVNMGKLGFLAEFSLAQLQEQFDQIISQNELYGQRSMLKCCIERAGRPNFTTLVVNELAITAGPPFRMIEVSIMIGQEHLANCTGDGLIVATPTGSTAYNLSAGGPILASSLTAAVITPLAAHSLSFRPLVVDLDKPVVLGYRDVHSDSVGAGGEYPINGGAVAVIDGQVNTPIKSKDKIIITAATERFLLVQNPRQSQWRLLNTKLHWGTMPGYGPVE